MFAQWFLKEMHFFEDSEKEIRAKHSKALLWTLHTNLERSLFVEEARVMIDKPRQLSTIKKQNQKKKFLQSKLSQLFHVACE